MTKRLDEAPVHFFGDRFVLCIACGVNHHSPEYGERGVAQSRYVDQLICSECGTKEAFEGFFWAKQKDKT